MKKNIFRIFLICLSIGILLTVLMLSIRPKPEELGIPLLERFPNSPNARYVWDMELVGDKLYVGSGNYTTNTGPAEVWYYDLNSDEWNMEASLPDEAINRFLMINGKLTIPGVDPTADWSLGNYYIYDEAEWKTVRTIPGGIHTLDMIQFHGELFAGLGVKAGETPIVSSKNNGESFESVPMKKNGILLDTSEGELIRVYDFLTINDTLYAVFLYESLSKEDLFFELYKYDSDNKEFAYESNWLSEVKLMLLRETITCGKVEYKNTLFFTTGFLYATDDMKNLTEIAFPNSERVMDLLQDETGVYALCSKEQEQNKYTISVWHNKTGNLQDFKKIIQFDYSVPAMSFAKNENFFYFGMGDQKLGEKEDGESPKNGMVLRMKTH